MNAVYVYKKPVETCKYMAFTNRILVSEIVIYSENGVLLKGHDL